MFNPKYEPQNFRGALISIYEGDPPDKGGDTVGVVLAVAHNFGVQESR